MPAAESKRLVKIIDHERVDHKGTADAFRLQAKAWRIMAILAAAEPEQTRGKIQWLFTQSVPYVNGPVLEKFIADNEGRAEQLGIEVGIFNRPASQRGT